MGNLGARPDTCSPAGGGKSGGGGAWDTFPELTYEYYGCGDDPATIPVPNTATPPPVNDPGGSPGPGGVATNGTIFPMSDLEVGKITDGTSNTLMFG